MKYESILFETDNGVAILTLNRPDKLNSFTQAMHVELRHALALVKTDPSVRVLLLTGAGRAFCAGQDLNERSVGACGEGAQSGTSPGGHADAPSSVSSAATQAVKSAIDLGASVEQYYAPLVLSLRSLAMPVICAVNGVAAGAGANLALACDIVLAAESASFIESFCKLGLIPDTGGTWHLPRLIGPARAAGLAMLGERLDATTAAQWGLIWKCYPDARLMNEALAMAHQLAGGATKALAYTKRALQVSHANTLPEQLRLEADMMRELGQSHDYREGVAAFIARREPRFKGE